MSIANLKLRNAVGVDEIPENAELPKGREKNKTHQWNREYPGNGT